MKSVRFCVVVVFVVFVAVVCCSGPSVSKVVSQTFFFFLNLLGKTIRCRHLTGVDRDASLIKQAQKYAQHTVCQHKNYDTTLSLNIYMYSLSFLTRNCQTDADLDSILLSEPLVTETRHLFPYFPVRMNRVCTVHHT
jgi:hypothetical protein